MEEFDLATLSKNNGRDGAPAYVAHKGKVIDVSRSKLWQGGLHMKRHHAGADLTADIQAAPHGMEVLDRYPQAGILTENRAAVRIPPSLSKLISRFPMLRRHPHPMTVHFPIVFMSAATVFNLLYLVTGIKSFETTALHCLGGGLLSAVVAILTGLYTWWLNYLAKPLRAVAVKKRVSIAMLITGLIVFVWRLINPGILDSFQTGSIIYLFLVVSLFPMVCVIGWFGAALSFPIERD
ncbi:MAG: cytochrome b5 domain-containing protein [Desulfobacterales bacterium]|nr:cytochrome b5 domain-containing protein [Desulfobacterales bacterium]